MRTDKLLISLLALIAFGCDNEDTNTDSEVDLKIPTAFSEFNSDNVTILLDGEDLIIETNGLPNHTSPYWSSTNARTTTGPNGGTVTTRAAATDHPLYVAPTVTNFESMAPGNIDDFEGSYELIVPVNPTKASQSSATGLGPIGIAISGSVIYNDQEGPNVPLDNAAGGLDFNGAHTGPQSYHYHLEPKSWSEDDDHLIGVIADGFLLYGRKCTSTGTYPTDLDASNGHTSSTKHSDEEVYHYHIENDLYLNTYYILFPGNYQGTASAIQ